MNLNERRQLHILESYGIEPNEQVLISNFEKGLISEDLFAKACEQLDIIKGGKKANVGETRSFGGREYIKTAGGWKFHGKGTGAKAQEHKAGAEKHAAEGGKSIQDHVKEASEAGLNKTIKESPDAELRQAAHQELERRKKEEHPQEEKKQDKKEEKEQGEKTTINSAQGDKEYSSQKLATAAGQHLIKPENYSLVKIGDKFVVTTNKRASQFKKQGDGEIVGGFGHKGEYSETKKEYSLKDVLADKEGRKLVDSIEERISDLKSNPGRKEHLEDIKADVKELKDKFGYKYDISEQEKAFKDASEKEQPKKEEFNSEDKKGEVKKKSDKFIRDEIDSLPESHKWGNDAVVSPNELFFNKVKSKTQQDLTKFFIKRFDKKESYQVPLDKRKDLWKEAKRESVDVKDIVPSQDFLNKETLKHYAADVSSGEIPLGISISNSKKIVLFDGHHRIAADILKNKDSVKIKIIPSYGLFGHL